MKWEHGKSSELGTRSPRLWFWLRTNLLCYHGLLTSLDVSVPDCKIRGLSAVLSIGLPWHFGRDNSLWWRPFIHLAGLAPNATRDPSQCGITTHISHCPKVVWGDNIVPGWNHRNKSSLRALWKTIHSLTIFPPDLELMHVMPFKYILQKIV